MRLLTLPCLSLALERVATRSLVVGGDGPVDVDGQTGVVGAVGTGEGQKARTGGAAAAGDVDLRAGDVELSTTGGAGRVQANVLEADQVLAGGDARGDGDVEGRLACEGVAVS